MSLPVLLPAKAIPKPHALSHLEWTPKRYLGEPQPPSNEDARLQEEFIQKQLLEGKVVKKTRPRRTVDYNGGMGRWILLLPPKAYPDNASTSLCTKFVHTSTNKIRCPVNVVTWTPEARRVLTGSTSGEFTLWNGLTFNFETILQAHDTAICAMKFNHSGSFLVSTDKSGIIKYFDPHMNNLKAWAGSTSKEAIRGVSFSPDDQRFATASDDSSIRIWSFAESRFESVLSGHGWDVKCVEWHPTKGLIVSGSKDSQVKFWDPRTGTCLSTLHQHKNTIQALSWSPNGNLVASASRDQTVRVFDIRAMKEFRVLKGHKKEVCSVAWHPVHPILVSGGSEGSILHWDLSSSDVSDAGAGPASDFGANTPVSNPRATLSQAHDSNVWALAYHPLGHILVSGSNDHTTRFWSRERPGDPTSVFSGGGEKPPDIVDMSGQDDDDDAMVPGFGYPSGAPPGMGGAGAGGVAGGGGNYGGGDGSGGGPAEWNSAEDSRDGPFPSSSRGYNNYDSNTNNGTNPVGGTAGTGGYGGPREGGTMGGGYADSADDYSIPGFGSTAPGPSSSRGGGGGHSSYDHRDEGYGRGGGRDDWAGRDSDPREGRDNRGGRDGGGRGEWREGGGRAGGGGGYRGQRRGGRY